MTCQQCLVCVNHRPGFPCKPGTFLTSISVKIFVAQMSGSLPLLYIKGPHPRTFADPGIRLIVVDLFGACQCCTFTVVLMSQC